MEFTPVLPSAQEKAAIYARVANIIAVPGPIRSLMDEPADTEDDVADFAADLVDRLYDLAEHSPMASYPHFAPTHTVVVVDGTPLVQDNMDAPSRYEIVEETLVPNPDPPPAEVVQRTLVPGPTLLETFSGATWPTKAMLFTAKVDSVDLRDSDHEEEQSFVCRCQFDIGGTVYACDIGVGYMGDENTRTYYEVNPATP